MEIVRERKLRWLSANVCEVISGLAGLVSHSSKASLMLFTDGNCEKISLFVIVADR